jgi:hypothetical protein
MLPLPPVARATGWVNRVRLGRDYYVRLNSSDYFPASGGTPTSTLP